jgi:hypothetical protein
LSVSFLPLFLTFLLLLFLFYTVLAPIGSLDGEGHHPSNFMLSGEPEKARASFQRIRGGGVDDAVDVEAEFKDIVVAAEEAHRNKEGAFQTLRSKGYRHYLVMVVAIPTFFDLTGMVVIVGNMP